MVTFSPMTLRIFRQLSGKPQTAKEIASALGIFPNDIYRSIDQLAEYGFVKRIGIRPLRFISQRSSTALDAYLNNLRNDLMETLVTGSGEAPGLLEVSFIQNRTEFIEKTNADLDRTVSEADFIVSGLELPAESMLSYKNAIVRGVRIRIIVQNLDETKKRRLESWKTIGVKVRHYPIIEARIAVFDTMSAFITSYNPQEKEEGRGVRFGYAPIARILKDLFAERWAKAKEL